MTTLRIQLVCLLLATGAVAAEPASQPDFGPLAVGPYLLARDTQSMSVCWATSEPDAGAVEFGETVQYDRRVGAREKLRRQKVTLTGLTPGTAYHYRVILPGGATSDLTFRTLPGPDQRLTFVCDGDQRGSSAYLRHLGAYRKIAPAFVISLGDICNDNATDYDAILLMDRGLWASTPWYPVFGNHDLTNEKDRDGRGAMRDQYAFSQPDVGVPMTRVFYSFDAGGGHFCVVDEQSWCEYANRNEWDTQRDWMEKDLKAARVRPGTRFAVSLRHDADGRLAGTQENSPKLEDLYFFGGVHNYSRGVLKNGTVVVQTSGGGVDHLRDVPEAEWVKVGKRCFNYVRVDVNGGRLTLRAFDLGQPDGDPPAKVEGELIDTLEMTSPSAKKKNP